MLKKENLKMDLYSYLKYCYHKMVRGVSVITDKQYIFYSQIDDDDSMHDVLGPKIENEIHPNDYRDGWDAMRNNNVHVSSLGNELIIYLPDDRTLSLSQYCFLEMMIDDVLKYNKESEKKILFYVLYSDNFINRIETRNAEEVKDKLFKLITKDYLIEEEEIIGITLDRNVQINNMIYHIDLCDCELLVDLKVSLSRCLKYYNDTFYRNKLLEIFPDFEEAYNLIMQFNYDDLFSISIGNINFNNVKQKLISLSESVKHM